MNNSQRKLLTEILRTQSVSRQTKRMRNLMRVRLEEAGMHVEMRDRQIFARKGRKSPVPFIVAHSDTVYPIVPNENYRIAWDFNSGSVKYYAEDPKEKKRRGIGGDDKCGLFVALQIAQNMNDVGVIITTDEEIGCVGAKRVKKEDLEDASVLIQADRRGGTDAVKRISGFDISGEDWQEHVETSVKSHGYTWHTWGANTDVFAMQGTEAASVSAVNLSAGYHLPHTENDWIDEEQLENAFELALALAEKSREVKWAHKIERHVHRTTHYSQANSFMFASSRIFALDMEEYGYHGSHLVRGINHLDNWREYRHDVKTGMALAENGDGRIFLAGGSIFLSKEEIEEGVRLANKTPYGFTSHLRDVVARVPAICSVASCVNEAYTLHCVLAEWMCDEHIQSCMRERGETMATEFTSERTQKLIQSSQLILRGQDGWDGDHFYGH